MSDLYQRIYATRRAEELLKPARDVVLDTICGLIAIAIFAGAWLALDALLNLWRP